MLRSRRGCVVSLQDMDNWFMNEVLPLEAALVRFLRRNWSNASEIADLRQEVYLRAYEAAKGMRPTMVRPYVFRIARNLISDRARRSRVVSIEAVADIGALDVSEEAPTMEQQLSGREELRLLQAALETLPPRCREVMRLRKIEGLSQKEVARYLGIAEATVEKQVSKGVRALTNALADSGRGANRAVMRNGQEGVR